MLPPNTYSASLGRQHNYSLPPLLQGGCRLEKLLEIKLNLSLGHGQRQLYQIAQVLS
jgi:hypothetical protein